MAHGTPDWGVTAQKVTTYSLQDMAELAARLGSINTFDRRGDTVWMDDFENGLVAWATSTTGTGAAVAVDTTKARHGAQCIKVTTSATNLQFSGIYKHEPMRHIGKWGLEVAFNLPSGNGIIAVNFNAFSTATQYPARIKWNSLTTELLYMDANQDDIVLASNVNLLKHATMWHLMKLIVDPVTGKYVRLLVDGNEYDMSAIALNTAGSTQMPRVYVDIGWACLESAAISAYLDDVIVTQNEP